MEGCGKAISNGTSHHIRSSSPRHWEHGMLNLLEFKDSHLPLTSKPNLLQEKTLQTWWIISFKGSAHIEITGMRFNKQTTARTPHVHTPPHLTRRAKPKTTAPQLILPSTQTTVSKPQSTPPPPSRGRVPPPQHHSTQTEYPQQMNKQSLKRKTT